MSRNLDENRSGNYCGYEYDRFITSEVGNGPRGEYYHFVLVKDGQIIAFGDEQGNYAGGIYASFDFMQDSFIKQKDILRRDYQDLYEKIKDIPLAPIAKKEAPKLTLDVAINELDYNAIASGVKDEYCCEFFLQLADVFPINVEKYGTLNQLLTKDCGSNEEFTKLIEQAISEGCLEHLKYDAVRLHRRDNGQTMTVEVKDMKLDTAYLLGGYYCGKGRFIAKLGRKL